MFDELEDRANTSVLGRMANARALIGASDFPVIFENGVQALLQGMVDAAVPSITLLDSDLGDATMGDAITVTYKAVATNYLLRNPVADGAGLTVVSLELAP